MRLPYSLIRPSSAIQWAILFPILLVFSGPLSLPLWASETKSSYEKVLLLTATEDKAGLLRESSLCLRANAKDTDVLSIRARTFLELDRLAEARADAERALAVDPRQGSALTTRGYCRIVSKDYKGALVDYEAALKNQEPLYYVPLVQADYRNLAALYKVTGQGKLCAEASRKVKLEALVRKACECRESGAVDQTIRLLTVVLTEQPNFHKARLLRGVTYNNKSEYRLAIKDFDYLIKAFPRSAWFYYLRSDSYNELGDKDNSLRDLLTITTLKPVPKVIALNYTAQTGRVREHFEGKDENIVNMADIYCLLGSRYLELGKFEQAKSAFDNCLALDKNEVSVRLERAALLRRSGNNSAALNDLNLAISARPKFIDPYLERAKLKDALGDPSALADYSTVVALGPKDPGSYMMRAEFYRRNKQFVKAVEDFNRAVQLSPRDADAYIGRGQAYESMSQWAQALTNYRQALPLSPEDKSMLEAKITRLVKLTSKTGR
ncbi:tetratricopeptide repeat protein [bacterium]|nr:tetratricopeptide repeat protein [bacterium]